MTSPTPYPHVLEKNHNLKRSILSVASYFLYNSQDMEAASASISKRWMKMYFAAHTHTQKGILLSHKDKVIIPSAAPGMDLQLSH